MGKQKQSGTIEGRVRVIGEGWQAMRGGTRREQDVGADSADMECGARLREIRRRMEDAEGAAVGRVRWV